MLSCGTPTRRRLAPRAFRDVIVADFELRDEYAIELWTQSNASGAAFANAVIPTL